MTLNYPDEDHWTWRRFVTEKHPGTQYFRIPPGELASAKDREEWTRALAGRPDMLRRLLEGKPGTVILGAQVAVGFNEDQHAPIGSSLKPDRTATLWLGQDGGLTPTTVIGQRSGPRVKILAGLSSQHDGIKQHIRGLVLPWLQEHTPWVLGDYKSYEGDAYYAESPIRVHYDPSMNKDGEGDTEANPLLIMRSLLRARYVPGPMNWQPRLQPLLTLLGSMDHGEPSFQVDPVQARGVVRALNGGWHYATDMSGMVKRDEPVKNHPHSDYGDALAYMIAGMAPALPDKSERRMKATQYTRAEYDPRERRGWNR